MDRALFSLHMLWKHRQDVRTVRQCPVTGFADLEPSQWGRYSIDFLVLDMDGVLLPQDEIFPTPQAADWLNATADVHDRMALFTNNPFTERVQYWQEHYPGLRWIMPQPKKPYPDALIAFAQRHGWDIARVGLLDDRMATGGLCAVLAGAVPLWWRDPIRKWGKHWRMEMYFEILRRLERMLY